MTVEIIEEELPWEVDDPENASRVDEEAGIVYTTMPDNVVIGWDICGCGVHVTSCGCDKIKLPRHVLKMRDRAQQYVDRLAQEALEAREKAERSESVEETEDKIESAPEAPRPQDGDTVDVTD